MINIKVIDEKGNETVIQIREKGINYKDLLQTIKGKTLIKFQENAVQIINMKDDKVIKGDIQLKENDKIMIKNTEGNEAIIFGDITKEEKKDLPVENDSTIPYYLEVKPGLNIFGICENPNCELCKTSVIAIPIEEEEYDAVKERFIVKCRKCRSNVIGKVISFYNCFYNYYGIKFLENQKKIEPFGEEIKDFQKLKIPPDGKININGKSYTIHKTENKKLVYYKEDVEKVNFIKLNFQIQKFK